MRADKATIQDEQYGFPYHYLPALQGNDSVVLHRSLPWGLDYLTYMSFLAEIVSELGACSLLDVGCGDGRFYGFVRGKVSAYKGVDISERAIEWARCFNPGIDFEAGDCRQLDDSYDVVSLIETLEHVPDDEIETLVAGLHCLVKPTGRLLISVPSVNLSLNKKHYRHYDEALLRYHLSSHFEVNSIWWVYRLGVSEKLFRRLLSNRFFALNHRWSRRMIWKLHRKWNFVADRNSGAHLVCVATPIAL